MKKQAWSFSVLSMFEQCRKKYYHIKVLRSHKDADSDAARDGKFVHERMFDRVINRVPLPVQLRHMEQMAKRFADALADDKQGEMRLALNDKLEPRSFFAKDVWVRAVLDYLAIKGETGILVDWKTGKKKDNWDQLKLSAAILSRYMPELENFKLVFVWLKDNEVSTMQINKSDLKSVWLDLMPRARAIDEAVATTDMPANPTPLCGWCPVDSCPHWKPR